jgi:hypothetical protein
VVSVNREGFERYGEGEVSTKEDQEEKGTKGVAERAASAFGFSLLDFTFCACACFKEKGVIAAVAC